MIEQEEILREFLAYMEKSQTSESASLQFILLLDIGVSGVSEMTAQRACGNMTK